MISRIKNVVPFRIKVIVQKIIIKIDSYKAFFYDRKRFNRSSFYLNKNKSKFNLEAEIIFYYHKIEKGLSNINFRYGFGKDAIQNLLTVLEKYKHKHNSESVTFMAGLSVIDEYIKAHENDNIHEQYIQTLREEMGNLSKNLIAGFAGVRVENGLDIIEKSKKDFKTLTLNRFSVRDYDSQPVSDMIVTEAISIAQKTPSVCNRQPWHVRIIKNEYLINELLKLQGGFRGYGNNLTKLILITCNNSYLRDYTERNQGFIDSGMFSMSLIYAFQYLGVATCPLNADMAYKKDLKVRKLLNIPFFENLVMFIAFGNYPDNFKVPKSPREKSENITTWYC